MVRGVRATLKSRDTSRGFTFRVGLGPLRVSVQAGAVGRSGFRGDAARGTSVLPGFPFQSAREGL